MDMRRDLHVHVLDNLDQVAQHLQHVHPIRAQTGLRRDAPPDALDALL